MINSTMTHDDLPDWFAELLVIRSTDGLNEQQQQQFERFVQDHPQKYRIESEIEKFELTVAAVDLGFQAGESEEVVPHQLRQKLLEGANRFWDQERSQSVISNRKQIVTTKAPSKSGLSGREAFAWFVAAAAVVLLLTGWNPFAAKNSPEVANDGSKKNPELQIVKDGGSDSVPDDLKPEPAVLTVEQRFKEFVSSSDPSGLTRVSWDSTDKTATRKKFGEVVWSDSLDKGYMIFSGLRSNDPLESQYQLWIFDKTRNEKFPVDGGVFDVLADGQTIVEIDSRLPISEATMFAVTEEIPGGVVVSTRERIPLIAQVAKN